MPAWFHLQLHIEFVSKAYISITSQLGVSFRFDLWATWAPTPNREKLIPLESQEEKNIAFCLLNQILYN